MGKNLSKVLQNLKWGDKEGNLDEWRLQENGKVWAKERNFGKNGEYAKKSLATYSHKMTKKGIWTNGDLFGENL